MYKSIALGILGINCIVRMFPISNDCPFWNIHTLNFYIILLASLQSIVVLGFIGLLLVCCGPCMILVCCSLRSQQG